MVEVEWFHGPRLVHIPMILALLIDRVDLSGRVGLSGRGFVEVAGTKTATDRSLRLQAADQRFGPYWLAPRCVENAGRGITDCSCDREPLIPPAAR